MQQLATVDGSKLVLSFHPGQSAAWNSERRFVFMLAGTQGGKTSFGPHWLRREIDRRGAGDYIAATATYDLFKLKMLPAILDLFVYQLGIGRYRASDKVVELADPDTGQFSDDNGHAWGRIILRSANAPGGLESATAKGAWLDECGQDEFAIGAWEAVLRRLSLAQGRVLGTTTPYNLGWLKSQIWDRWAAGDDTIDVIRFASVQNPLFPREEFERARATLPPWKFRMFYEGMFDRPPGLIYDVFDTARHVVEPFTLQPYWPRYGGQDYGGVNTAALRVVHDTDSDRFYVTTEYLQGGQRAAEHAANLRPWNVGRWFGGAKSEEQWRREFRAAGVSVSEPPVSDVEVGIDRVYGLIKSDRLYVFNSCVRLLDELGRYSRELDDEGEPTEKIANKSEYHMLDALRYVGSHLAAGPVGLPPVKALQQVSKWGVG